MLAKFEQTGQKVASAYANNAVCAQDLRRVCGLKNGEDAL
jgi:hypothetical protein